MDYGSKGMISTVNDSLVRLEGLSLTLKNKSKELEETGDGPMAARMRVYSGVLNTEISVIRTATTECAERVWKKVQLVLSEMC